VKQEPVIGTFATASEGAQFSTNSAASFNSEGYLYFRGNRVRPDEAYSAVDSQLVVLSLTAQEIDGPSLCAPIAFVSSETKMAALGGVSIPLATLASTDVLVLGTTTVTGTVDLQGRGDESGAVASISTGLLYGWAASPNTTDPLGDYAFTDLTDDQYTVSIEMARYLDASAVITVTGDLQELPPVELLAGDANDSDFIDISDMSIIGGQYGFDGPDITDQRADINADGLVDIVDLVLAGGNYWLATSPWTT